MAKFIELDALGDGSIYVNPHMVTLIRKWGDNTCEIHLFGSNHSSHVVKGTAKEIKDKIEKGDSFYTYNYNDTPTSA